MLHRILFFAIELSFTVTCQLGRQIVWKCEDLGIFFHLKLCIEISGNDSTELLLCKVGKVFSNLSWSILGRVECSCHFLKARSERLISGLKTIAVMN